MLKMVKLEIKIKHFKQSNKHTQECSLFGGDDEEFEW